MNSKATYRNRVELLQGTLDMLILQSLQWGPQHGYALSQAIRLKSSEALQVETGSLYPALHRLERQGWVSSEWRLTESKQRARFYAITPTGKVQLADDHSRWRQMVEAIDAIMQDKSSEAQS
jgi:transcriptional regulator